MVLDDIDQRIGWDFSYALKRQDSVDKLVYTYETLEVTFEEKPHHVVCTCMDRPNRGIGRGLTSWDESSATVVRLVAIFEFRPYDIPALKQTLGEVLTHMGYGGLIHDP